MATFTKNKLSGSTNGRGIEVAATSTAGTTIHTSVSGTTAGTYDEIWLYAINASASVVELTIEFGGTTSTDDHIVVSIDAKSGLMLIVPGLILQNSCVVGAFAATTNVINIFGFVNSIVA